MDSLRNALPTLPHRDLSICIAFLITLVAFIIFTLIHRCPIQINRILANLPGRVRRIVKRSSTTSTGGDEDENRSLDNQPGGVRKPSPISSVTSTGGDEDENPSLDNLLDGVRKPSLISSATSTGGDETQTLKKDDVVRDKRNQFIYVVKFADGHQTILYDAFSYTNRTNLDDFERVKTAKQSPVKIEKGNEYRLTDDIKTDSLDRGTTCHEYKKGAIVKINLVPNRDFVTVNESGNLVPKKMLEEVPQ